MLTKLRIAKFVVSKTAAYGTSIIVGSAIANNLYGSTLPVHKKVAVAFAGAVISSMFAATVSNYVDRVIDDVAEGYIEYMAKYNEQKAA